MTVTRYTLIVCLCVDGCVHFKSCVLNRDCALCETKSFITLGVSYSTFVMSFLMSIIYSYLHKKNDKMKQELCPGSNGLIWGP